MTGRLVTELKACEEKKAHLKTQMREVVAAGAEGAVEVGRDEIEAALSDLRSTLDYATPEEQKALVQEHIREIRVPEKGLALLETDPTGLLSSLGVCEFQ